MSSYYLLYIEIMELNFKHTFSTADMLCYYQSPFRVWLNSSQLKLELQLEPNIILYSMVRGVFQQSKIQSQGKILIFWLYNHLLFKYYKQMLMKLCQLCHEPFGFLVIEKMALCAEPPCCASLMRTNISLSVFISLTLHF